jgi:23S rRNA (cytidine1920-2'-O)/16S rRNA (cytidine1409-2'-O)-methyltransferase
MDWRLRTDPRVVMLEGFNARELTLSALEDHAHQADKVHAADAAPVEALASNGDADAAVAATTAAAAPITPTAPPFAAPTVLVCDASFIPLATVLPAAMNLCAPGAVLCALVKPQFEARREQVWGRCL